MPAPGCGWGKSKSGKKPSKGAETIEHAGPGCTAGAACRKGGTPMEQNKNILVTIPPGARPGGSCCGPRPPGCAFRFAQASVGRASFGELLPGEPLTQELADWADICLGNLPAKFLHGSEKLLWLQTNSAGVEEYVRPGVLGENTPPHQCHRRLWPGHFGVYAGGAAGAFEEIGALPGRPEAGGLGVPGQRGVGVRRHGAGAWHGGHRRGVRTALQGPGGQDHRGAAQ